MTREEALEKALREIEAKTTEIGLRMAGSGSGLWFDELSCIARAALALPKSPGPMREALVAAEQFIRTGARDADPRQVLDKISAVLRVDMQPYTGPERRSGVKTRRVPDAATVYGYDRRKS